MALAPQHDQPPYNGAPAHRLRAVRQRLAELLGERVVALYLPLAVEWPLKSPNLTPCDFFLRGYPTD